MEKEALATDHLRELENAHVRIDELEAEVFNLQGELEEGERMVSAL